MKTIFKLTAIAAVAATLSACGGGGGGGSSIASTPAVSDYTVNQNTMVASGAQIAAAASYFGANSHLSSAHASGYTGQGVSIASSTVNMTTTAAGDFNLAVKAAAPNSSVIDAGNLVDSKYPSMSGYVAIGASSTNWNGLVNGTYNTIPGIVVSSFASNQYAVESGQAHLVNGKASTSTNANDVSVNITSVNPGNGQTLNQQNSVAYLAGSAAVISSKFNNLQPYEVAKYMGQSTNAGVFTLGTSLAPRGNLR